MKYQLTTVTEIRADYWRDLEQTAPKLFAKAKRIGKGFAEQDKQPCTIRSDFVEYLDSLRRNGAISDKLARRATL